MTTKTIQFDDLALKVKNRGQLEIVFGVSVMLKLTPDYHSDFTLIPDYYFGV